MLTCFSRNKQGELQERGLLYISFAIVPFDLAKLSKVGIGRDSPNMDPVLPEPPGRVSLIGGMFGGLFSGMDGLAGKLKTIIMTFILVVGGIAATA